MNKKGILIVVVLVILGVIGYMAFRSDDATTVENQAPVEVPEGVSKDDFAPVTEDSVDSSLIGRLKNVSVGVTEDGSKVALSGGKATFAIADSNAKGSVSLGEIAIEKTVGSKKYILAVLDVTSGSSESKYLVLFQDVNGTITDKSYGIIGSGDVTGLRADEITDGGELVVSVSYEQGSREGTKIFVVENGVFNLNKTLDL